MSTIVEAIDQEIAILETRAEQMRVLRSSTVAELERISEIGSPAGEDVDAEQIAIGVDGGEPQADGTSIEGRIETEITGDAAELGKAPPASADSSPGHLRPLIIKLVRENPGITGAELVRRIGRSRSSGYSRIAAAVAEGSIVAVTVGNGKCYWTPEAHAALGDAEAATSQARPPRQRARDQVRREGAADRVDRSGRNERREQALKIIRRKPGLKAGELATELGVSATSVTPIIRNLRQTSEIRVESGPKGAKLLFAREHELAKTDESGAKTEVERKLLAAVQELGEGTTAEISEKAGVRHTDAASVLGGLSRRGVIRAVPRKRENDPARYGVAR